VEAALGSHFGACLVPGRGLRLDGLGGRRGGGGGGEDDDSPEGQRQREVEAQLLEACRRRAALSAGRAADDRRRLLAAWLSRRGHAWDAISRILRDPALLLDAEDGSQGEEEGGGGAPRARGKRRADADSEPAEVDLEAARRYLRTTFRLPPEVRQRRLLGWLSRRGHAWPAAKAALAALAPELSGGAAAVE
jgi:hypothetical protein